MATVVATKKATMATAGTAATDNGGTAVEVRTTGGSGQTAEEEGNNTAATTADRRKTTGLENSTSRIPDCGTTLPFPHWSASTS